MATEPARWHSVSLVLRDPGMIPDKDGCIEVPDLPGLGIDVDEAERAEHPPGRVEDYQYRIRTPDQIQLDRPSRRRGRSAWRRLSRSRRPSYGGKAMTPEPEQYTVVAHHPKYRGNRTGALLPTSPLGQ